MEPNPYEAPRHFAERQIPVWVIRSKKPLIAVLCVAASVHLIGAYFDRDIANAIFGLCDLAIAGLVISGRWPRPTALGSPRRLK